MLLSFKFNDIIVYALSAHCLQRSGGLGQAGYDGAAAKVETYY